MMIARTTIANGGRIVIPAALRKQLALKVGDQVTLAVEGDELRLRSLHSAIARAQTKVREYVAEQASLSDELVTERRLDAARD